MSAGEVGLDLATLHGAYRTGQAAPIDVIDQVLARIDADEHPHVWITRIEPGSVRDLAQQLTSGRRGGPDDLPLFGVPFAIKDNIDLAGLPTTAACPDYGYLPSRSATAVQRLIDAGAIPIGKTNLDQFATGLVGTRSPYGAVTSPFDPRDIAGGSSSGSAVAVAAGLVSFALGTDTAGSGRVPAGLNNIVGIKPTPGVVPNTGVVPACRSIDVVSVFALQVADASSVLSVISGADGLDPLIRAHPPISPDTPTLAGTRFTFGVPDDVDGRCDPPFAGVYAHARDLLVELGGEPVEVPFRVFTEVADLLYEGPWLAERLEAAGTLLESRPEALHPVTRKVLRQAGRWTAIDVFRAQHHLAELRHEIERIWRDLDLLVVPTTPTTFRVEEVIAEPLDTNAQLGHYTNFANLLQLPALAVPVGFASPTRPAGVTLLGARGHDAALEPLGAALHRAAGVPMGATGRALPQADPAPTAHRPTSVAEGRSVRLAVVGAHLRGEPLHRQLVELGAAFERETTTARTYRLFALPDRIRPGMVRDATGGAAIEVEVFRLSTAALGRLVSWVTAPLSIGLVELADGSEVLGYLCEHDRLADAIEITHLGGWRSFRAIADGAKG